MAIVPKYQRTEKLNPRYTSNLTVHASAENFGASIGRGLVGLGQGISQTADVLAQVRELEDSAIVKDRLSDAQTESMRQMYDPQSGFMNLEGKNAIDAQKGFEEGVKALREKHSEGLTPAQKAKFDRAFDVVERDRLQRGIVHTGSERKNFIRDSSKRRLITFNNEAFQRFF